MSSDGGPAAAGSWQPVDASSYVDRLEQVKVLLEQAARLASAQESARVAPLVELQRRLAEEQRGHPDRRPHG